MMDSPRAGVSTEPLITVPETFKAMPRWWRDDAGRDWLQALPELIAAQCRHWQLRVDGYPLHGSNALVVPVRRSGLPLTLRLAPPGDDVAEEAAALAFWDGRGTVRLVEVDETSRALLLERLDSTRSLSSVPLRDAIPVIAELVGVLAVPAPVAITSTVEIAAGHVADFERDWSALDGPTPRRQLDAALELAEERAAAAVSGDAVDGDLHCRQVLAADRSPWLVVDPVLLRGDREYDFARVLWDRLDELPADRDVVAAFDAFVGLAQVPAGRARSWIVLRSMSYLLWGLPRGLTTDPARCRRLLDLFS